MKNTKNIIQLTAKQHSILTIIFSLSQEIETYSTALTDSESTAISPPSLSSLGANVAEFQGYEMGELYSVRFPRDEPLTFHNRSHNRNGKSSQEQHIKS